MNKRRTWRKLYLGINAATHRIEASIISTNAARHGEAKPKVRGPRVVGDDLKSEASLNHQ